MNFKDHSVKQCPNPDRLLLSAEEVQQTEQVRKSAANRVVKLPHRVLLLGPPLLPAGPLCKLPRCHPTARPKLLQRDRTSLFAFP